MYDLYKLFGVCLTFPFQTSKCQSNHVNKKMLAVISRLERVNTRTNSHKS
jgi:hypothetical protein